MSFWRKWNGKLICDENGHLIDCSRCPCEPFVYPCNDWLTEIDGDPILYNVSISLTARHYEKWHQVYGEGEFQEEEFYTGEDFFIMTASLNTVLATAVISNSLTFPVDSVSGFELTRYEYHTSEGVDINQITNSLSSIIGGGCPSDDPGNVIPDDMLHGWTFVCNENQGQFYIRINPGAGTCHGTIEEYYETPYGTDTYTSQAPLTVGVPTNHLTFPNISAKAQNYQNLGFLLKSNTINLSYHNGNPSDDDYEEETYVLTINFTPIIPGAN